MRQNLQTHSGNRLVVEADGKRIGLAQSWRVDDNFGHEAASGIGDARAVEFVPGMARFTLSITTMVLFRNNLVQLKIIPKNVDDVLRGMELDFVLYSRDTGDWLTKYIGAKYDSGSTDVQAHRIVTKSASFMVRDKDSNNF